MRNKTKEEIEQLGREIHYQSQNEGLDSNGCFNQYQGFIKGYTQCQEKLTARILELESEIKNSIIQGLIEISCNDNDYNKVEYEKWLKDPNTKIFPMTNTQCNFAKFLFKESSENHLEKIGNLDDIYLSIRRYIKP